MFCVNCGTQLPDGSKFCFNCGSSLMKSDVAYDNSTTSKTKLIPAKCTNCGANLEVDATQQAAICPFCKSAYIVEQAIQNYNINVKGNLNIENATINVNGIDADNLVLRAKEYENEGDYDMALNYYNQVLDVAIDNQEARNGVERVNNALNNYIYFESPANRSFSAGKLQLKRDKLIFTNKKGQETVYELRWLKKPQGSIGGFTIVYGEIPSKISFVCKEKGSEWIEILDDAIKGIYPIKQKPVSLDEYIMNNFDSKSKIKATIYYKDMAGVSLSEARKIVDKLL